MSDELPKGWESAPLATIAEAHMGETILAKQLTPTGLPVYSAGQENIAWGFLESPRKPLGKGTVVVSARGSIGFPKIPKAERFASTQTAIALQFPDEEIAAYGCLWLKTVDWSNLTKGGAIPMLTVGDINELVVPLAPLAEQRRIVAKLETLLGKVDASQQRLAKIPILLKRFRQSVLAAACSGRLTADWRKDDSFDNDYPAGWETQRLDSIFKIQTGGTPSRKVKEYFLNGTISWVKTGEVQNCDIAVAEEFITEAAAQNSNAKVFPAGTILIAMYGEGKTRGQIGRLTFPAATNQACAALINTELPRETSEYVFYFLLGQYYLLRAQSVGGNQPNLNLSIIKQLKIALPPLSEQREIVRRVEELFALADQIEARFQKAKTQVEKLTPSLLARAFAGKLVPQDPADEPAAKLLKRLGDSRVA